MKNMENELILEMPEEAMRNGTRVYGEAGRAEHGREMIGKMVDEEVDSVLDMKASSVMEAIDKSGTDFGAKAADIYESAVKNKSGEMLERLNIGGIMQETIEDMDNEQLEDLVMSTMKTELGAVVNFGAVIGLALGIINMIIYLI